MADDLTTTAPNTWCPGCGNFGIYNALRKAVHGLGEKNIPKDTLAHVTGIGCHGKIFDYIGLSGFAALHGRALATAQGIQLSNPGLKVIVNVGDGDTMGEGLEHVIFSAKRNADMAVILHDNGVYALTTGQVTPLSEKGFRGPSTPGGNPEEPLNPLVMMLEAGATFVARGYSGKTDHLAELIVRAVMHEGFAFIDCLQPCVSFNNTYERYNRITELMDRPPAGFDEALSIARRKDKLALGVFYDVKKPPHHRELQGERNPARDSQSRQERLGRIRKLHGV